jgi:hypothetical protein
LSRVNLNGGDSAIHHPLLAMSCGVRNDVTRRPIVGTIQATVRLITAMCRTTPERRSASHRGENLAVVEDVGEATATVIASPPRP